MRHCATSRKVAGSFPDGVTGIFHWHNPSGRTMALGLTQPLKEMSIRNISWGVKVAGVYGWQPYHLHVPTVLISGSLNLLEPSGPVQARPVQARNGIALPFTVHHRAWDSQPPSFPGYWYPHRGTDRTLGHKLYRKMIHKDFYFNASHPTVEQISSLCCPT